MTALFRSGKDENRLHLGSRLIPDIQQVLSLSDDVLRNEYMSHFEAFGYQQSGSFSFSFKKRVGGYCSSHSHPF